MWTEAAVSPANINVYWKDQYPCKDEFRRLWDTAFQIFLIRKDPLYIVWRLPITIQFNLAHAHLGTWVKCIHSSTSKHTWIFTFFFFFFLSGRPCANLNDSVLSPEWLYRSPLWPIAYFTLIAVALERTLSCLPSSYSSCMYACGLFIHCSLLKFPPFLLVKEIGQRWFQGPCLDMHHQFRDLWLPLVSQGHLRYHLALTFSSEQEKCQSIEGKNWP